MIWRRDDGAAVAIGLSEHLARLSRNGDPLVVLEATVDFEYSAAG
jgi:hypothetical protein